MQKLDRQPAMPKIRSAQTSMSDMQNKIKLLRQRKLSCLISATLVFLFFALVADAAIESRWAAMFSGLGAMLLALVVLMVWVIQLIWLLSKRPSVLRIRVSLCIAVIFGVMAGYGASLFGNHLARITRAREIQPAIDAGLREDCMYILTNWPFKEDRIDSSDAEIAKLPASIKILSPAYVEKGSYHFPNLPPNVGICKNGFGGFSIGVRVFQSDADAKKFESHTQGRCERLVPSVYIWWHPT